MIERLLKERLKQKMPVSIPSQLVYLKLMKWIVSRKDAEGMQRKDAKD